MLGRNIKLASAVAASLALGACGFLGGDKKAPTGQVVAKVEGQEITMRDLAAEMNNAQIADPTQRKQAQMQALQNIIMRRLVAKEAKDEKLDQTPEFALLKQRTEENLLAEAYQAKIMKALQPPGPEEVSSYISSHPDLFAQHKVFTVEQVQMPRPSDQKLMAELRPLTDLGQIVAVLDKYKVPFKRGETKLDILQVDPRIAENMAKLKIGEIFIAPVNAQVISVNAVREVSVAPLTEDQSKEVATAQLKRQHAQETMQRSVQQILAKAKDKIVFNKDFQPAKVPAALPGSAPPAQAAPAADGQENK
jgi:peptidyl-prolyl cis-trans isomerase C